jgi:hypothetical protein
MPALVELVSSSIPVQASLGEQPVWLAVAAAEGPGAVVEDVKGAVGLGVFAEVELEFEVEAAAAKLGSSEPIAAAGLGYIAQNRVVARQKAALGPVSDALAWMGWRMGR